MHGSGRYYIKQFNKAVSCNGNGEQELKEHEYMNHMETHYSLSLFIYSSLLKKKLGFQSFTTFNKHNKQQTEPHL